MNCLNCKYFTDYSRNINEKQQLITELKMELEDYNQFWLLIFGRDIKRDIEQLEYEIGILQDYGFCNLNPQRVDVAKQYVCSHFTWRS